MLSLLSAASSSTSSDSSGVNCFEHKASAIAVGTILILGIQISYLPQHYSIISKKSSLGINPVTFLLSNIGAYCNFAAGLLIELDSIKCCAEVSFGQCNVNLLSIYQLSVGFINNIIMYGLLLTYFTPNPDLTPQKQLWERRVALYGYVGYVLLFIGASGSVVLWMLFTSNPDRIQLSDAVSVIASVCNIVTWLPQIWQTYRLKSPGALSVGMLLLQAPGALVVIIFQGILEHKGPQTWAPYVATGTQQTILIVMCLYYSWQERRKGYTLMEVTPNANQSETQESRTGLLDDEGYSDAEDSGSHLSHLKRANSLSTFD